EQVGDAAGELFGDGAAAADDLGEVNADVAGEFEAAVLGFGADLAGERAVLEQRLGRNAAPIEAGAAEVFLLDAEDAFLELSGADGGGVAGGTPADHDDVELVILLWRSRCRRLRLSRGRRRSTGFRWYRNAHRTWRR